MNHVSRIVQIDPHVTKLHEAAPETGAEISNPKTVPDTVGSHEPSDRIPRKRMRIQPAVLQHTVFSLAARASMLLARGLSLILISRRLGGEQFGVYALLLTAYSVFLSLGSFGIEQTNLYLAGRRAKRASMLVGNSLVLALLMGAAAAGLCVTTILPLHDYIFTGASFMAIAVTAFALPVAIAHNAIVGIILGLGRFRYYGIVEILKWSAYLGAVVAFYSRGALSVASALGSLYGVLLCAVLVHLGAFACLRTLPSIRGRLLPKMLGMGRQMLLVQLMSVLGLRLDVYAVRLFGSIGLVGTYALAAHLSEILMYAARSFTLVVFSGTARGTHPAALRVRLLVWSLVAGSILLCCGLFLTREGILLVVFGETARGTVPALMLRMPGVLATAVALLYGGELLGRGRADIVFRGGALWAVVLGALVWPLFLWGEKLGAAAAFTIAAMVQLVWIRAQLRKERALRAIHVDTKTETTALDSPV